MTKHLWEIDHPYYCSEGNYFAGLTDCRGEFETWEDFFAEYHDSDFDMNLLFRWDWLLENWGEDDNIEEPIKDPDPTVRDGKLLVFWMGQRKGIYHFSEVKVCANDEPAVRDFLRPRWEHMKKLWEGIADDQ